MQHTLNAVLVLQLSPQLTNLLLQVFLYSSYNRQEVPGECTEAALNAREVRWAKVRPPKEPRERAPAKQTGIPAEDGEDLGIEYR